MAPRKGGVDVSSHESTADRLRNITIPEKIKCARCHKFKQISNYSKKQLNDYRYKILKDGINAPHQISCRTCTGTQVTELRCRMCEKVKGLEDFAKAQRRVPDTATCYGCMEQHLETDPVEEGIYDEREGDESDSDLTYVGYELCYHDAFESAATASAATSVTGLENLSITDTSDDLYDPEGKRSTFTGNSTSIAKSTTDPKEKTWATIVSSKAKYTSSTSTASTGFNPKSYGVPNKSSKYLGSAGESSGSLKTSQSVLAEKSSSHHFAKVKAYKPPKSKAQSYNEENEHGGSDDEWKSQDEDTDSDNDSDNDLI